jgi:hypothetical protein
MQRKILALAAAVALGTAGMSSSAMALGHGGGFGGHMGGGGFGGHVGGHAFAGRAGGFAAGPTTGARTSRSSVEHDLFGKPVSTFPDHALS